MGAFRLVLATLMTALGLVIIGRSLWLVLAQGLAVSSLFLPVIVGGADGSPGSPSLAELAGDPSLSEVNGRGERG